MCSIQEENELLQPLKREETSSMCRKCMKCEKTAVVVIRMNDPMCSECFIAYATHKFRSAFGKSKIVRDQERVIVAFSGGASSSAMVHLIQGGLSKRAQKKLRFIPSLLYIDEGAVTHELQETRIQTMQNMVTLMKHSGLPYKIYSLEQAMVLNDNCLPETSPGDCSGNHTSPLVTEDDDHLCNLMERLKIQESPEKLLQTLLESSKSLTTKENLVRTLRFQLLSSVAKQHGINKILLGDSASRLSVRLLSSITQGQGAHLPYQISFADKRDCDFLFIRPMREFTAKEVGIYNQLNGVETVFIPNLSTKAGSHSSLDALTESFVTGLQAEYPNTVSTILRTGDKFDCNQKMSKDQKECCCICQCPLDTNVGQSSALIATKFSQSLCTNMATSRDALTKARGPCGNVNTGGCEGSEVTSCCGQGDGSCQQQKSTLTFGDLEQWLCYGCRVVAKEMVSMDKLPVSVISEATRRTRRAQMKKEISDFLLDE